MVKLQSGKMKRSRVAKIKKKYFESICSLYHGWKSTLNAFKSAIFPVKLTQRKELKNLKQMVYGLYKWFKQMNL